MPINSKQKGKTGELEAAKLLSEIFGTNCRRGVQYQGGPDSPDVVGIPGIHFEVKRCESLSIYTAMDQAERDSGIDVPCVLHRRNHRGWLFVVQADDLADFVTTCFHLLANKGN